MKQINLWQRFFALLGINAIGICFKIGSDLEFLSLRGILLILLISLAILFFTYVSTGAFEFNLPTLLGVSPLFIMFAGVTTLPFVLFKSFQLIPEGVVYGVIFFIPLSIVIYVLARKFESPPKITLRFLITFFLISNIAIII